jgi:serine/threonine-protein kinase
MSPEQIRSLKNVDARADLWALGVILYELVTGLRPFDGRTATAICASICADPYIPPRSRHGEVPEGLDAVLRACLEKDPARRVGSVAEFASALAPFASAGGARSIDAIDQIVAQSTPVSLSEADIEVLPTGVLSAPGPTPGPARAPSQALASSPVDARSGGADTAVASGGTKPPALQPPLVALGVSIALLALAGGLLGWVVSLRARPMHSAAGSTAAEPADRPQVTIAVAPAAPVVRPAPNVVEEHAPAPASAAPSASADAGAPGPRLPMGQPRAPKRLPLQPGPVRGGGANPLDRLD